MNIVILNPKFMGDILTSSIICPILRDKYGNDIKIHLFYAENIYKNRFEPLSLLKNFPKDKYYSSYYPKSDDQFQELYTYRNDIQRFSGTISNSWKPEYAPNLIKKIDSILAVNIDLWINLHQHYTPNYGLCEKDLLFAGLKDYEITPLKLFTSHDSYEYILKHYLRKLTHNPFIITISDRFLNHKDLILKIKKEFGDYVETIVLSEKLKTLENRFTLVQKSNCIITPPCIDDTFSWACTQQIAKYNPFYKIGIYTMFHKQYKFTFNDFFPINNKMILYEGLKQGAKVKLFDHTIHKIIHKLRNWIN